jgi:hypothetical protein
MEPLFYYSFNAQLMATSLKCTHWTEAQKATEHLNARYPTSRSQWITTSNKPPLSPEQCCGWMRELTKSAFTSSSLGMPPTGADDDDLYC